MDSVEDWYGAAAVGLCKAGIIFDKTRGIKFSTLAFVCMENEVRRVLRHAYKHEIQNVLSLDYPLDDTDNLTFGDLIPDDTNYEDLVVLNDAVRDALDALSDRNRDIVEKIMSGLRRVEVAHMMGYSKTTICNVYNAFLRKVEKNLRVKIME
jgi:RNA polymerase sigma factor (sigma-70 family)